jgi:single-strand DNA-binding protein
MASKNAVSLIGRLGKDPEFYEGNGTQSARLAVATTEKWKDKTSGEWKEKTEWHQVVVFGTQAIYASKHLTKGSMVAIEGSLRTDKYVDANGVEKFATKVIGRDLQGLDRKQSGQSEPQAPKPENKAQNPMDDDIPF